MKKRLYNNACWLLLCLLTMQLGFTACSDDENVGTPEITAVRVADPEKADSTFVKAWPGSQIVIIGSNLQNAHHVYINDQSVYFNPTMNTDHSIILTIPTEEDGFELASWNDKLKAEIRVETNAGTATYAFNVLNPAPSGQRVAGLYPREAGDNLKFHGKNLLDVVRVYITDQPLEEIVLLEDLADIAGNQVEITNYDFEHNKYLDNKTKVYVTESVMSFTLPSVTFNAGTVVVECEAGYAMAEYAKLPPKPVINSVSSDMPITGAPVKIHGQNFIQVESVKYADVVIPAEQLNVAESEDCIEFVMGEKPEADATELIVTTPGGEVKLPFYEKERVLLNFDGLGFDNGWGPNAVYESADASKAPYTSDGVYSRINVTDNGWNWWGTMIYWRSSWDSVPFALPSYDLIPADTPAEQVYLAMEVYNANPFNGGAMIHYQVQTVDGGQSEWVNWDWNTNVYIEPVLCDIDGETPLSQWYRSVIPMSRFGIYSGKTYKDIVESGLQQIRFMNHNYTGTPMQIDVCIDNVRIITK